MNMNNTGTEYEGWILLPQNMVQWCNAVSTAMKLRVQYSAGRKKGKGKGKTREIVSLINNSKEQRQCSE
jgi:hypothetical protein